jgi:hypothetical protein
MKTKVMTMLLSVCALATATPALANQAPDPVSQALAKVAEPRMKALADAARADKGLDDQLATYRREAKAILGDRGLKESEKQKQLASLGRKYEPVVKLLMKKARIDELQYQKEGEQEIKRIAKSRPVEYRYLGYLGWMWRFLPKKPKAPIKADVEITLSAPFPFDQLERNGEGEATANKETGRYSTYSFVGFAGAHDNVAGLAHFHRLTESFRSVQVFAALPETSWSVGGFADVFAVFGSSAKSRVEIFANNRVICAEEVEHASFLAPIIYYAFRNGTDNVVVNCEVNAPSRGDEIVIKATSVAGAWGGGLGAASARVTATPRDLRMLLKR